MLHFLTFWFTWSHFLSLSYILSYRIILKHRGYHTIALYHNGRVVIPLHYIPMGGLSYHCIILKWEGYRTIVLYPNGRVIIQLFRPQWEGHHTLSLSCIFNENVIIHLSFLHESAYFPVGSHSKWEGYHIHYSLYF